MKSPLRFLGLVFLLIGLPFFIGGLLWIKFALDSMPGESYELLIGPAVFCFIGFVFVAIGGGVFLSYRRKRLKREMLMRTGRRVKATITSIAKNLTFKVNNRHPHVVICSANVSGKELKFKSENIFGSLRLNKGDELEVYLDFRDYNNYWVEIPNDATR